MTTFPETIPELLEWRASQSPSRPWLSFEGEAWTLGDVVERVERIAGGLADAGVAHGDRVAFVLGNRPETLLGWLAANHLGAIAMILNPALKPAEIESALRVTTPRVVIDTVEHAAFASTMRAPRANVRPDDVAVLIATSGTTGAPKAVMQTHRAYTLTAEAFPAWLGLDASDRLLVALPLFHINAQAYGVMGALGAGASVALLPKFSASRFWPDAARVGATEVNMVGAMVHILLKSEPRDTDRAHGIRVVYTALALPEEQHRAFEERFGVKMVVGYGLSESTFGTIWTTPRYGTMGSLRQHPRLGEINRARVVRDDGTDANDDEAGELWLHNPATMSGYWNAKRPRRCSPTDGFARETSCAERVAYSRSSRARRMSFGAAARTYRRPRSRA